MNNFERKPVNKTSSSMRKKIYGIATNDSDYVTNYRLNNTRYKCPVYVLWLSMLTRCYSPTYLSTRPSYKDCVVCDDWLIYSNFQSWVESQNYVDMELDKDIEPNNKLYCPQYCCFISPTLNKALQLPSGINGSGLPQGVWEDVRKTVPNTFRVKLQRKGMTSLARYGLTTSEEAGDIYRQWKHEYLLLLASSQSDKRIQQGVINFANTFYL